MLGTLAGLANMHRHYGSLPWARLCDEAVRLARDGFGATAHYRNFSAENVAVLEADERSAALFLRGGRAPRLGTLITQPHLARSLEEIAWGGAETLYRGALARSLAKALKECGALITEVDLAEFEAEVQEPLGIGYHGLQILEAPPNSTGFVLLEELKILENFVIMQMGLGSADLVHVMVEPKSSPLPIARAGAATRGQRKLRSGSCSLRSYCARLAAQIDMSHAAPTGPGPTGPVSSRAGETTCFCTADDHGNAVSGIQSINSFWGPGVMAGDTGILLNNRMAYWHLEPGHPNFLLPGRRVRHTMNPPLVLKEGKLWGACGTPGADNQVQLPDRYGHGRFRPRSATGGRNATLDLDGTGPICPLPP